MWNTQSNSHSNHNHNSNGYPPRNNWGLVLLYMLLTAVTVLAFWKGCNRDPFKLETFKYRSTFIDTLGIGSDRMQDNVVRLYDEDSVLYIGDIRYSLVTVQKQLINNDNTWILGSYFSTSTNNASDTTYIGIEFKNGFIKSVTTERADSISLTIETYY
jgi:hypothetical protein